MIAPEQAEIDILDPVSTLLKHMRLECIGVTPEGLLERIPGPYPDDIANFLVAKHSKGFSVFFSRDLPRDIRDRLGLVPVERVFAEPELVKDVLGEFYPKEGPRRFKSYIFPNNLDTAFFSGAILLAPSHEALFKVFEPNSPFPNHPAFGIIVDDKLVCVCESSKENGEAAESWVRTLESYQRRGFAKQATLAWAYNLQQQGKTPFYSHKGDNFQSLGLARSLGLIECSDELSY